MLKLVEPNIDMKHQYSDYITEWEVSKEKIVPAASRRNGKTYEELMKDWEEQKSDKAYEKGFVPASLYFLVDEKGRIYGSVHIRYELNDGLLKIGGHIGYGIRPSERRKGYAAKILSLALPIAKGLGIKKALITCDKVNIGSARTIIKNGGTLENEVLEEGEIVQRYWIDIQSFSIRVMTIEDYEAVYKIWTGIPGVGLSDADSREAISRYLERNKNLSFVCYYDDEIIGCILCGHDGRRGYFHHTCVLPEYQGKGIGTNLVNRGFEALKGEGINKCHIFVFCDNEQGNKFWSKLGWGKRSDLFAYSKSF